MNMRIAHLGSKGMPSKGGTERVVEALAIRQAGRDHVTVYGSAGVCQSTMHAGVRVIALRAPRAKHAGPAVLQLSAALHALTRARYDVVHVHGSENGFIVPMLRTRYPVVTTNHGPAYEREKWSPLARRLIRANERFSVLPASVATAVAAEHARELGARYGKRLVHIPNGTDGESADVGAARMLLTRHGLEVGGYIMFAAARVDPTKGCHTLLEAVRRMGADQPVLVLGDLHHAPGYAERLRSLAAGMPVVFAPRVEDKATVLGLLMLSKVFVFPSTVEAMSMMLLEALAVGALTLASDIPENTDVLPPGYPTFRAGDATDLAARLTALLSRSGEARGILVRAAMASVLGRFDWDVIVGQYDEAYRTAVAGAARA
jgi:glycosyltransferase involved in cell wall biosynthesis